MSSNETKTATAATVQMIKDFSEMPGETFDQLKGVLVASHSLDDTGAAIFKTLINCQLIAKAMDAINQGDDISNPWDLTK